MRHHMQKADISQTNAKPVKGSGMVNPTLCKNQRVKGGARPKPPILKSKEMYKHQQPGKGSLRVNKAYTGETIEAKVRRMVNNKETIKDTGPLNYTERKDGVVQDYDVRTDRWDVALDAMDAAAKSETAKRAYKNMSIEERQEADAKRQAKIEAKNKKIGKPEPLQGTQGEPSEPAS